MAAAGFIALVAAASGVIVHVDAPEHRVVVQTEINQTGQAILTRDSVPANPAGDGAALCPPLSIAMAGPLTGVDAETGINIKNGVQMAIDKHNAANSGCQVQIKEFDTAGDPRRVGDFAPQIVADVYTVGVIGPTFSGVAEATGQLFESNGLPAATASASRTSLSEQGWRTFFRAVASDEAQGRAVANYLKNVLRYGKVCVISDNTPYGDAVAFTAGEVLGGLASPDCRFSGSVDDEHFVEVIERMKSAMPDAVLRTGAYASAPAFVRRLRDAGITSAFVSAQAMARQQFATEAGDPGKDALLFCPCGPEPEEFTKEYRDKFGGDPGPYSAEGYDLATIMLRGIDAGMLVRTQMLDWMRHYDGQGLARRYKWTASGELKDPTVWVYKVQ